MNSKKQFKRKVNIVRLKEARQIELIEIDSITELIELMKDKEELFKCRKSKHRKNL